MEPPSHGAVRYYYHTTRNPDRGRVWRGEILERHGFDKCIFLNGHRLVNIPWLQIAGERAKRELEVKVCIFDPAYMSKELTQGLGWGEVGHADEIESSHMWHCYPELVQMDRARDNPHKHAKLYHDDPRYPGIRCAMCPAAQPNRRHWSAYQEEVPGSRARPPGNAAGNTMNTWSRDWWLPRDAPEIGIHRLC